MRWFGLTSDQVLGRVSPMVLRPPSRGFSLAYGALSFTAVTLIAYSVYAYRIVQGAAAMYSTIAEAWLQ